MTYNCSKLSKYSLIVFLIFFQLIGCGCKKGDPGEENPNSDPKNTSGGANLASEGSNPGAFNPVPGGKVITQQRMMELLDSIKNENTESSIMMQPTLEALIEDEESMSEADSRIFLYYAIQYENIVSSEVSDDIVTLAVGKLQGDINKPFKTDSGATESFLGIATRLNNEHAKNLLLQKGAE